MNDAFPNGINESLPREGTDYLRLQAQRDRAHRTSMRYAKARKNGLRVLTRADLAAQCQRNK